MPFELRMNMFLVKCSDINNALCDECESLIDSILSKVGDHVFAKTAPEISQSVKNIQEELQQKSMSSADLVKNEKRLEEVKNIEHKKLQNMYADLIEWLVFLNNNPKFRMNEDYMKPIQNAYKFMNQIASIIEKAEQKLKQERTDIENALYD